MSTSISLFIVVFTTLNIAACLWLLWWTAKDRSAKSTAPATHGVSAEKTGHVWDGDLEEYNNPLPRWWLGVFILTVVFGAIYLALYPGLGNFLGTRGWSQIAQYEAEMAAAGARLEQRLACTAGKSLAQLAWDASAMSTARNLFGANCSTCHGSDARGAKGFPNLSDRDWLWGSADEHVYESIASGRHGAMPALGAVLGEEGVKEVASYVASLGNAKAPADWVAAGKTHFATLCVGCHGADGTGNPLLGAPNLTDRIWLHGGDFDSIRASIATGRDNQMPAHLEMLGAAKVRLLAAYVLALSAGPASVGTNTQDPPPPPSPSVLADCVRTVATNR